MRRARSSRFLVPCLTGAILALASFPNLSLAATLTVGPGKMFSMVRAAAAAAQDGDLVLIDAGTYLDDVCIWNASNLTVRGVGGGRAYIKATNGTTYGQKGNWVIAGNNFTAEDIEFSGGYSVDQNGAGMRFDISGDITIRNCYFHDNQDGILGGCNNLLIESSIFEHNGYGDGQSHNLYVWGNTFTLRYSYSHRASVGHEVKSRFQNNYILYNRIMDESDGTASYSIDIPDCGRSYIIGNVIEQGPNSQNSTIIAYGAESSQNGNQDLYLINNTLVNDAGSGNFLSLRSGTTAKVMNNIFYGPGTNWSGGTVNASNNYFEGSRGNGARFVSPSTYDYHPTSASPASIVDAGGLPGLSATGYNLLPTMQYVYDAQGTPRSALGTLDVGAFEYGSGSGGPDGNPPSAVQDLRGR
ncbi:MAG TPA: hypothetical protein VET83_10205 [Candidatus Dormibacteraeota bacterium]|nr:hypothetical protein [Candidatus Dormibacteraeota bacterium]